MAISFFRFLQKKKNTASPLNRDRLNFFFLKYIYVFVYYYSFFCCYAALLALRLDAKKYELGGYVCV